MVSDGTENPRIRGMGEAARKKSQEEKVFVRKKVARTELDLFALKTMRKAGDLR